MTVVLLGAKSMMFIIKLKITQLFRFIWEGITNWLEINVFAPIRITVKTVVHSKPFIGIMMLTIGATWTWSITFAQYEGADILRFARAEVADFVKPGESMVWVNPALAKTVVTETKEEPVIVNDTKRQVGEFSAYNAEVGQTDANPFVMASGKKVYDGAVANNCLKFGSKIEVKGKTYTVEDRMNSRYGCEHFDIFMWEKSEALTFGRQTIEYSVVGK